MFSTERVIIIAGAVVAVLLQVMIAPHIAYPNFIAAFCLVAALVQPRLFRHVMPFALGLVYDLLSGGPIGAMAFALTASAALVNVVFQRTNNDTAFMGLASLATCLLALQLIYGIFLLACGFSADLFQAFAYRMLPCFVSDFIIVLILYPLATRFLVSSAPLRSEITQLH